ncbi:hypothetical protein L1049_022744 [Liquidambar formosana]|uniref:Uncharacterized protein n=1 Tax=Liquidambar formosana TaxID=63359 RepID=A0AAP0REB5_LIQFO
MVSGLLLVPAAATGGLNQHLKFSLSIQYFSCSIGKEKYKSFSSASWKRGGCCNAQLALPELAPATSAAYGVLLLGGGLFAYTKSGSKGSLLGGLTGSATMATACFLMQASETKYIGYALGFGSAFLFSSVFGIRLAATRKLTPAGPLLGLSIFASVVFISAYLQHSL